LGIGGDWRRFTTSTSEIHGVEETAIVALSGLDVQHFAPHITRTGLAEIEFDLNRRFQCLDIMEDQREGQQATGDGNGAENDSSERDRTRRAGLFVSHFLILLSRAGVSFVPTNF